MTSVSAASNSPGAVQPRALHFLGVVPARAFWFPAAVIDESMARQRILSLWQNGCTATRYPHGLLLRLPEPILVNAHQTAGTPLVERSARGGTALIATPLSAKEWQQLDPGTGDVIIIKDAVAEILSGGAMEDPALWLDVSNFQLWQARSLGTVPEISAALQPVELDLRKELKDIPPPDERLIQLVVALQQKQAEATEETAKKTTGGLWQNLRTAWSTLWSGISTSSSKSTSQKREVSSGSSPSSPSILAALLALLALPFMLGRTRSAAQSSSNSSPAQPPHSPFRHLLSRMAMFLRLGKFIGHAQARYIARMVKMFEDNQWEEALKHAIPLGGDLTEMLPLALRVPTPRSSLNITPQSTQATSTLGFGPDLQQMLRTLYRRAFDHLRERNRIDEAAFVLAELLNASEEAVAFLEAHGRLRLAAEMAEARKLAPGLVVRQWFLAGERNRAVLYARQHNAFQDAVLRLERTSKEDAHALRLLWADSLAQGGNYMAAVEAVWPVTTARSLALNWIERGVALGGITGARLMARRFYLDEALPHEWLLATEELLAGEWAEDAAARHAFAQELIQDKGEKKPVAVQTIARAAVRSVSRDHSAGLAEFGQSEYRRLLHITNDAALRADAATLRNSPRDDSLSATPYLTIIEAADATAVQVHDAVWLPDGTCALALGESGVRLVSRNGRTICVMPEPAHELVLADSGSRAIGIAPRGEAKRLAHFDFAKRKATYWEQGLFQYYADTYDGSQWFVADKGQLVALDAQNAGLTTLWTGGQTGGDVLTVARNQLQVAAWVFIPEVTATTFNPRSEVWFYSGSPPLLRGRPVIKEPEDQDRLYVSTLLPDGQIMYAEVVMAQRPDNDEEDDWKSRPDAGQPLLLRRYGREVSLGIESVGQMPSSSVSTLDWVAVTTRSEEYHACFLLDAKELQVRAVWKIYGTRQLKARFNSNHLVLCDDAGRVLVFDCDNFTLRRNLRIS